MELNDVLSQSDAIRKEIVNRIHCQVEDFEVVEYDSEELAYIGVPYILVMD